MPRRTGYPVVEVDGMLMASVNATRTGMESATGDRLGRPVRVADLVGATGTAGRDGVDGAPGRDGTNGADGRNGVDGAAGKDGANGKDGVSPYAYAGKATTNASGIATVTFPAGKFTTAPVVQANAEAAASVAQNAQVVAGSVSKDGCQVKVWQSTISLLVLGTVNSPVSGGTVHVTAMAAS